VRLHRQLGIACHGGAAEHAGRSTQGGARRAEHAVQSTQGGACRAEHAVQSTQVGGGNSRARGARGCKGRSARLQETE
jgi:hypothetical protein